MALLKITYMCISLNQKLQFNADKFGAVVKRKSEMKLGCALLSGVVDLMTY